METILLLILPSSEHKKLIIINEIALAWNYYNMYCSVVFRFWMLVNVKIYASSNKFAVWLFTKEEV